MKSFNLSVLALCAACVTPAHAQSVESIFASKFENLCPAPNNQGVAIDLVNTLAFENLFGTSFPGTLNSILSPRSLATNQAIAYSFVAPEMSLGFNGYIMTVGLPGASVLTSISECPGIFGAQLNSASEFCDGGSGKSEVLWKLAGQSDTGLGNCTLVPGRTYFLNIGVNDCTGKACGSRIVSRRFF